MLALEEGHHHASNSGTRSSCYKCSIDDQSDICWSTIEEIFPRFDLQKLLVKDNVNFKKQE